MAKGLKQRRSTRGEAALCGGNALSQILALTCDLTLCSFNLRKAQKRQHIVEGLLKAMQDLDKIVAAIRAAKDGSAAAAKLQQQFGLSAEQVRALSANAGRSMCCCISILRSYSRHAVRADLYGIRGWRHEP